MSYLIPWLATLFFGLCVFLLGSYLQRIESKKRSQQRGRGIGLLALESWLHKTRQSPVPHTIYSADPVVSAQSPQSAQSAQSAPIGFIGNPGALERQDKNPAN